MLSLVTDFERWALFSDNARDQPPSPQSSPAESRTQRALLLSELQKATQRRQAALAVERVQLGAQVQAIARQRETATAGATDEPENIPLVQSACLQPASEQRQTKKELPKQQHPQAASNRPQRQTKQPAQKPAINTGSGQQLTLEQRVEQRAQRALAADARKRREREQRRREQEAQRRRQRDREQEKQNASTTPSPGSELTTQVRWAAFREWSAAFSKFNSPKTPRPTNTDSFSAIPWPVFVFRDPPTVLPEDVVAENVRVFLVYAATFKSTNEMEVLLEQIVSLGLHAADSPSVKRAAEAVTTAVAKYKAEIMAESTRAQLYDYNARYSSA